jgi:hypothetical protein
MSNPHVFGLQKRTPDGVSTTTSRLDERFRYRKNLQNLERVLKRQVDDCKTIKQLAATGQDRATGDRLRKLVVKY